MRLTTYTNYALRTLVFAALRAPALVRVQDVAAAHAISRTHLVKCVHQLGLWGYLDNVRGRGGGFRLARPPERIGIGEIVRRTEAGVGAGVGGAAAGTLVDRRLQATFDRAHAAFLAVLDRHTLADILGNADDLRRRLGLGDGHIAATAPSVPAATSATVVARSTSAKAS